MNTKTNQEIFFVAEAENNKVYKFDLVRDSDGNDYFLVHTLRILSLFSLMKITFTLKDVGASAKESFSSLSGEYQMVSYVKQTMSINIIDVTV